MKEAIKHLESEVKNLSFRIRDEEQHLRNFKSGIVEVNFKITSLKIERESFKEALLKLKK